MLKRLPDFDFSAQPGQETRKSIRAIPLPRPSTDRRIGDGTFPVRRAEPGLLGAARRGEDAPRSCPWGDGVREGASGLLHERAGDGAAAVGRHGAQRPAPGQGNRPGDFSAMNKLVHPKVLIIDEVGYLALDSAQASLLFQAICHRCDRGREETARAVSPGR